MTSHPRFLFVLAVLVLFVPTGRSWAQDEDEGGDSPKMSEEYRKKWTTDPANEDPRWRRAALLRFNGKVDEAVALYEEFLAENSDEVSVAVSLGTAMWEKARFDEAVTWFEKAKVLVPRHVKARQFLGQLHFFRGDFTKAKKEFEDLLALNYDSPGVMASAQLNLAKIALLQRQWGKADRLFYKVGKSPELGDRHSAEKGRMLAMLHRKTKFWPNVKTKNLDVYFSPEVPGANEAAWRDQWAATRAATFDRITKKLKIVVPEPILMYCVRDQGEGYEVSNQDRIPSWRYSWWTIYTAWDSDPARDLAYQLVARAAGSRPACKPFVVGLVSYLEENTTDHHGVARRKMREGDTAKMSLVQIFHDQSYSLERAREYAESLVAFLIDTYGFDAFIASYREYNMVMLDTDFINPLTKTRDWTAVLSEIFRRGVGVSAPEVERAWHEFLRS